MKIKKDDIVVVLNGNSAGSQGRVLSVNHGEGRVVVEGVNQVYKHVRRSQKNPQGGRLTREMPISVSNVMLVCPHCSKPTRVGVRFAKDGAKERHCKQCDAAISTIAPPKNN
ncbi:MAG: 50S ribosomal protein L24 [Planctomycetales bacterium]|nr:50S ribosomal protein L24 [Planctomycetales bacterium]